MGWKRPLLVLLFLWLSSSQQLLMAQPQPLQPYTAEYTLQMGSITVGKINISLEINRTGDYIYRAHTVSAGLAALFRNDEITEISRGVIRDGLITPSNYFYHHIKPKKVRKLSLDFDWTNHRVSNQMAESNWSMEIPTGTQDKFSQQLALMSHLATNGGSAQFKVADGGRLKTYHFNRQDEDQLKVAAGSYHVIKVAHARDKSPSHATFWMAPELHYLPVKIVKQEKDGKFTVELSSITWNSAG